MFQHVKSAPERWDKRIDAPAVSLTPSLFPDDAAAVIYRPSRSAMTSGKARSREWKLRFEPRTQRYIEPLMGWTGNDDPLAQVELSFPSAEAAVAYAQRQGLHYVVHGEEQGSENARQAGAVTSISPAQAHTVARPWRLEWIERTLGPEAIRNAQKAGDDPSIRYAAPQDVLHDPALSEFEKREVLRRWALDAYLIELSRGDAIPHLSRLDEVIDALIDLDSPKRGRIAGRPPDTNANERALAA